MAFNFPCFDHIIRVALSTPGISLLKRLDTVTEREKKKIGRDRKIKRETERHRRKGGGGVQEKGQRKR